MENNTAKHFVLQLGSLVSLYLSLAFLLTLLFGVINLMFPDTAENYWEIENAQSMIRIGFAMLVVFFPTYLILTRIVNKLRRKESNGKYLSLTKWLIYLSLLVGGLVLLIDLVVVIMTFLEGEITERFIFKALAVLITIGAAFYYYIRDARGYWIKNEKQSKFYGLGALVVVVVALVFGLLNIDTPSEVREHKIDESQVEDLQSLQWAIQDYYLTTETLPESLDDVNRADIYTAPEGRADYRYEVTETGFKLCAEFKTQSQNTDRYSYAAPVLDKDAVILGTEDWYYEAGDWCFERKVNNKDA